MRNLSACPAHCSQRLHEDQLKSRKLCWEQPTSQKGAPSAYTVWTPTTWPLLCRIPEVSEPAVHCAITAGTPRTPLPACPAQERLPTSPSPPSLRGPPTRRPLHWVTGSWEDPRGSEGPQLRQSGQGCGCPTPASQHCEASAPSLPSINRSPSGARKRPRPRQQFKHGGGDRRTWSRSWMTRGARAGARGAGAHAGLGHTWQGARGAGGTWRPQQAHVGHVRSLSGTQPGTCPPRALRTGAAPPFSVPGLNALPQASRCQRLRRPPTPRASVPWMVLTIRAKGWKCGQLTRPGLKLSLLIRTG